MRGFSISWLLSQLLVISLAALLQNDGFAEATTRQNLYNILEVKKQASTTDIKKSYRRLSMKYHPDKNKAPDADAKFKDISYAYQILGNPEKRKIYDTQGHDGLERLERNAGAPEGHPFDMFADLFGFGGGGGGGGFAHEIPKVPPTNIKLWLTLEQLFSGVALGVEYTRSTICLNADSCTERQPNCKGAGVRVITQQMAPGFLVQNQIADPSCIANGKSWVQNCSECPNGITELETTHLSLRVEQGARAGERIELDGVGEQRLGHEAGDVIYTIFEIPHERYVRKQNDLHMELQISLADALLGFSLSFKHIDGANIEVSRKDLTHDGLSITIKNKGMPVPHTTSYGDLHITFRVKFPKGPLTEKQRELIRQALVVS